MSKKIIITESQFKRLFIIEQGGISGIGNISKELPISDRKKPDFKKLASDLMDTDYHTVLDVASIAALIIPPPAGVLVSAGLDVINALSYGIEAYQSTDPTETKGNLLAGGLTLLGVIPGVGEARTVLKNVSPKVLKSIDDILIRISKLKGNVSKEATENMFKKATKELSKKEVKYVDNYLNAIKESQSYIKKYTETLTQLSKKYDKKLLMKIGSNKNFIKILNEEKGDVIKALERFKKTEAGKDFLTQLGFFVGVSAALPPVLNKAAESGLLGIKKQIQKLGYTWEMVKEKFYSSGSKEDNIKLEKAWNEGWRPGTPVPEKYQTDEYKKNIEGIESYESDLQSL